MASHASAEQGLLALVGRSAETAKLRAQINRVAPFNSNVLITGPSGTGKELVARQVHACSPRSHRAFIPVDCAAITGELMASQLFGHTAGAFTGASCAAIGCFRAADHGTIFLDEIGELDYLLQCKLLRVLQERVVIPVGSHTGQRVDVRVVAATNRDLRKEVLAGRFREDLYYRLDVVHLRTTPLSERPDDIVGLAESFLSQLEREGLPRCCLSTEACIALQEFDWPGNVRQLRNVMEQAAIESTSSTISASEVRRLISGCPLREEMEPLDRDEEYLPVEGPNNSPVAKCVSWKTLESIERQHIRYTLEHTYYNRAAAARLLGVTRQSLLRKMKRYGLDLRRCSDA